MEGHTDWVVGVAFVGDGATLATAGMDGTIRIWDVAAGRTLAMLTHELLMALAVRTGSAFLASGSYDKSIKIWEIAAPR